MNLPIIKSCFKAKRKRKRIGFPKALRIGNEQIIVFGKVSTGVDQLEGRS